MVVALRVESASDDTFHSNVFGLVIAGKAQL